MQRKNIGSFDLILCGKQAMDSDTAQVGAELAEVLDLPQVTGAVEFAQAEGGYLVLRERKSAIDQIKVKGPCVLTIGNAQVSPRYPTMKSKMASMRAQVSILGPGDMDALEPERTGSGLELIEIAPGIDLERDILAQMEFCPKISDHLSTMDSVLFGEGLIGLRKHVV